MLIPLIVFCSKVHTIKLFDYILNLFVINEIETIKKKRNLIFN